jgi:hypothetical protein
VARVTVAPSAWAGLDALIASRELPADTRARVKRRLRTLRRFPEIGAALGGAWAAHRYVFGPWRWMLIVYRYDAHTDRVGVVTIEDARTARAATSSR